MTDHALQKVDRDGLVVALNAAAAGGDTLPCGADVWVHFRNPTAGALTVTLVTPQTVGGNAVADVIRAMPANSDWVVGPLDPSLFASQPSGRAAVTYSGAGVTVAALRLDR